MPANLPRPAMRPFHDWWLACPPMAFLWKRMWISWWTDPLRKVDRRPYHSAPTPILDPPRTPHLRDSEARPVMSQPSVPSSVRPMPGDPPADPPPPDVAE